MSKPFFASILLELVNNFTEQGDSKEAILAVLANKPKEIEKSGCNAIGSDGNSNQTLMSQERQNEARVSESRRKRASLGRQICKPRLKMCMYF